MRTSQAAVLKKNIPKKQGSVEFAYYWVHINKKTFMPMKMEFFKKGDRLYRVIEVKTVENIQAEDNGQKRTYPTVTVTVARDLENGSHSVMTYSNVHYNVGIGDKIFSERYLRRPPRDAMR
jgi:Outer membrane lipoprotein-sorting protein